MLAVGKQGAAFPPTVPFAIAARNVRLTSASDVQSLATTVRSRDLDRMTITQPTSAIRAQSSKAVGLRPANSGQLTEI
jgi:hypothetical protein